MLTAAVTQPSIDWRL